MIRFFFVISRMTRAESEYISLQYVEAEMCFHAFSMSHLTMLQ